MHLSSAVETGLLETTFSHSRELSIGVFLQAVFCKSMSVYSCKGTRYRNCHASSNIILENACYEGRRKICVA